MFKSSILICLLYCACIEGAVVRATTGEGYGYEPRLLGWLKLHSGPESWRSARLICHLEGAFLAAPWTVEFVSVINKLQNEHIEPMAVVYSGAHETIPEGAYSVVQGAPMISLEPRDLEAYEHCGVIYSNGTTGEVDCKQRLPFVCFIPTSINADDGLEETSTTPLPEPGDISDRERTTQAPSTAASDLDEPTNPVVPAVTCDSSAGYKYSAETGSCYSLHGVPVSWSDARRACRAEGGDLAVVNSAAEARLLADLIMSEASDWVYAAIGFSFDNRSGIWLTVSGQPLEDAGYNKWERNQPSDDLSFYGCGYLSRDALFGNSADPYTRPFICEKSAAEDNSIEWILKPLDVIAGDNSYEWTTMTTLAPPALTSTVMSEGLDEDTYSLVPAPACGDEYDGYKYSNETGQCYSLHSFPKSWSNARRTCRAEGGDLAVVNSAAEARLLAKLIRTEVPDWRFVAIGLYFDTQSGVWKTVDGRSIEEAGYDMWGANQPNDDLRFYNSGYLSRDAVFVNTADPYVRPFICEKTAETMRNEVADTEKEDTGDNSNEWTKTALPQATASETTPSDCGDYKYSIETGHCYLLHLSPVSWSDARRTCRAEGGDLAVVNSAAEARHLAHLIKSDASDWIYAAIGFSFDPQSDAWMTVSGQPLEYAGYDKWEHNPLKEDLNIYSYGYLSRDALFGNSAGSFRRPFICEKSPAAIADTNSLEWSSKLPQTESGDNSFEWTTMALAPSTTASSISEDIDDALALVPAPACGSEYIGRGYKYSNETKHCYFLHAIEKPWSYARDICRATGGDLAVVNSAAEARILANLIRTVVPDWSFVAVGFSFDTLSGVWKTVDGQSIKEAGFDKWGADQPNDDLRYYSSGYLSKNALFVNTAGVNYRPFICEKSPAEIADTNSLEWNSEPPQTESGDNSFEWTTMAIAPSTTASSISEDIDDSALALVPAPACGIEYLGRGYKYSNETKHCYLLHAIEKPWSYARDICRATGGDLAVVNSAAEARILANLIRTVVPDWSFVAVGFSFDTLSGVWKTVDGQSIKEAGFDNWGADQPNDDLRYYSSGYLNKNAFFVNTAGVNYRPFICERTPNTYTPWGSPRLETGDHNSRAPAHSSTPEDYYDGLTSVEAIK